MLHRPTPCSDLERTSYTNTATKVNSEIKQWLGDSDFELIGLGQNCNASWYIKATENKKASYPFDWIFTTPEFILDMLADDFSALLHKDLLIPHGMNAGHERYHETLFGHRNPASNEADREYLARCIDRLKEKMKSQKPVLFFTVILNEPEKRKRWKEGFTKAFNMPINQKLEDFSGMMNKLTSLNGNCKFLFVEQKTQVPFDLSIIEKSEKAMWVNFSAIDKNTGVEYIHEVDDAVMKTVLANLMECN